MLRFDAHLILSHLEHVSLFSKVAVNFSNHPIGGSCCFRSPPIQPRLVQPRCHAAKRPTLGKRHREAALATKTAALGCIFWDQH